MKSHKQWLDNEYEQWVQALNSSSMYNFKEHPMVKRMLGEIEWAEEFMPNVTGEQFQLLEIIDNIGRRQNEDISGTCWRMVYYAKMILKRNPTDIIEIGGGSGQFYAVMRAMGFVGDYYIYDIPSVKQFQYRYLAEVTYHTKLALTQTMLEKGFCVSLYALGEFDDELKKFYVQEVIQKKCPHGFVIWNPHSGATAEVLFECTVKDEYPLLNPGNKQLEW